MFITDTIDQMENDLKKSINNETKNVSLQEENLNAQKEDEKDEESESKESLELFSNSPTNNENNSIAITMNPSPPPPTETTVISKRGTFGFGGPRSIPQETLTALQNIPYNTSISPPSLADRPQHTWQQSTLRPRPRRRSSLDSDVPPSLDANNRVVISANKALNNKPSKTANKADRPKRETSREDVRFKTKEIDNSSSVPKFQVGGFATLSRRTGTNREVVGAHRRFETRLSTKRETLQLGTSPLRDVPPETDSNSKSDTSEKVVPWTQPYNDSNNSNPNKRLVLSSFRQHTNTIVVKTKSPKKNPSMSTQDIWTLFMNEENGYVQSMRKVIDVVILPLKGIAHCEILQTGITATSTSTSTTEASQGEQQSSKEKEIGVWEKIQKLVNKNLQYLGNDLQSPS